MEAKHDWLRVSAPLAFRLLRDLVRTRFTPKHFNESEPLCRAFLEGQGYLYSKPIPDDQLAPLLLNVTLLRGSSKQNPVVRLFATVVQGLVIELFRRGHALAQLERAVRERDAALFQAMAQHQIPESH